MKVVLAIVLCLPLVAPTLLGGQTDTQASLTDIPVMFATSKINEYFQSKDSNAAPRTPVKILSATQQVVAGIMYRYRIEMTGGPSKEICSVNVWTRMWLKNPADRLKVQKMDCSQEESVQTRSMTGSLDDDDVQQALKVLTDTINMQCNCLYRRIVTKANVIKTIQNGLLFRFTNMDLVETTCSNNNNADLGKITIQECPARPAPASKLPTCNGEVVFNPLASGNKYSVKRVHCA